MKRLANGGFVIVLFLFTGLIEAKNIYLIPRLSIHAPETLLVEWETSVPTPQGRIYIGKETEKDFMAQVLDFPMVIREKGKNERKKHRVLIRDIEPNRIYRLRVATEDPNWVEIRFSRIYRFKAVDENGKWNEGVVFDLGPFLGLSTGNTYKIFWSTNRPSRGEIHLIDEDGKERIFRASHKKLRQEVELKDLKGDNSYKYRVIVYDGDTTVSHEFTFHTLSQKGPFKIVAMGDSRANYHQPSGMAAVNGVNEETMRELFYQLYKDRPDLIFATGDLIQGYTDDTLYTSLQYQTFLESTWPISAMIPVLPVMGNHDATAPLVERSRMNMIPRKPPSSPEDYWERYFVAPRNGPVAPHRRPPYMENVYYVDLGDALFAVLNSDYWYRVRDGKKLSQRVDEIQRKWLRRILKKHAGERSFVFFHEPAYPVSKHYGSSLDAHPGARDSLWEILVKGKVDVVVCGHEHCYARVLVDKNVDARWTNPIWEFISGRAGAPLYRRNENLPYEKEIKAFSLLEHYILFTVSKDKITFETKALTGEEIDKGVIR